MRNDFRVLMVYPNGMLLNPPPVAYGIFTALLKKHGYGVDIFDGTLYVTEKYHHGQAKTQNNNVRPFSYEGKNLELKQTDEKEDFRKKLDEYKPNLVLVSALETVYGKMIDLLDVLKDYDVPVMVGGVLATHVPEKVLAHPAVDMACIGEGEQCLIEVCDALYEGRDWRGAVNLAYYQDGKLKANKIGDPLDLNEQDIPDYSLFEAGRFLRPMGGNVFVTIPVETNRGCPYRCTFCNSPSALDLYKKNTEAKFLRKKTAKYLENELSTLINRHGAEFVYFTSDTFLLFTDDEFEEFIEMYSQFKLPFWIQTRAETMSQYKADKLREVGCFRMSMGLEHGNYEYRKKLLKKTFNNETFIRASEYIANAGIPLTINNIIGFPDEDRKLIFDTIELNRKLKYDSNNCALFQPFHGTELRRIAERKGYVSPDHMSDLDGEPILDMPHLYTHDELRGLKRTFAMYTRFEKELWPQIEKAEKFTEEGNKIFEELSILFRERYFRKQDKLHWAN